MNSIRKNCYDTLTVEEMLSGDYGSKNVPDFKEVDDSFLENFASIMIDPTGSDDSGAVMFDSEFDFSELFGIEYLNDKFPGFPPEVIQILADENKENKEELLAGFVDPATI